MGYSAIIPLLYIHTFILQRSWAFLLSVHMARLFLYFAGIWEDFKSQFLLEIKHLSL